MNDAQRHHFHLKSGWSASPSPEVQALYTNVISEDRKALANGIDDDIASTYNTYFSSIHGWVVDEGIDSDVQATINEIMDWIRVPYA